ncbi:MAG: DNA replication/repair protein RecF [Culicoidibacterales bacterium]
MKISEIELRYYRNIEHLNLSFHPKINIFIGNNGQGKTNLVESIYTFVYLKSFRNQSLADLVTFNQESFQNKMVYKNKDGLHDLKYIYHKNKSSVYKDHIEIKKKSDFIGQLNAVIFVPEDLLMLKLSPQVRRSFIDLALSQVDKEYLIHLTYYQKVIKQRNKYLKNNISSDDAYLHVLNQYLYTYGSSIFQKREQFVQKLKSEMESIFSFLTNNKETFNIEYSYHYNYSEGPELFDLKMKENFERDSIKKETRLGIHRDDLQFFVNDIDAKKFASQGQQRTIILALKLALVEYIYHVKGEYPILILDDVFSEIDMDRKGKLLAYIENKVQTFITTTDFEYLKSNLNRENYMKFYVSEGNITEEELQ